MKFATVCSGIEAPSVAWQDLGWEAQWFFENDEFPSAVLAHHYPTVPNYGDMTKAADHELAPIDLLLGGTPCQDFSLAGLGEGLDGERGNLALEFFRIVDRTRPRWVVWENVPGVLSNNEGRDFGTILGALVQLGYGFAYRVLDAQYFGLAQRRKRVFLIGCSAGWQYPAAVLFESESLRWDSPPRREKREDPTHAVAPCLTGGGRGVSRTGETRGQDPVVAHTLTAHPSPRLDTDETYIPEVAPTLCANGKAAGSVTNQMVDSGGLIYNGTQITSKTNRSNPKPGDPAPTLCAQHVAPFHVGSVAMRGREGGNFPELGGDLSNALRASQGGSDKEHVLYKRRVRRLTPMECERLQGFPDGYTRIPYNGKPPSRCPDGPRYRAIGNSIATEVLNWLGRRIKYVDTLIK